MQKQPLQIFELQSIAKGNLYNFYVREGLSYRTFQSWLKEVFGKKHYRRTLSAAEVQLFLEKKGCPKGFYLPKYVSS